MIYASSVGWNTGHWEMDLSDDPAQTFRLIPSLVKIGLYRSALIASTELLKLAGLEGAAALDAPEFISRVRFGAYYLDWLMPAAESEGLSPLLMLSLMRQESTYEGFINSAAGARGLMQIIPTTGAQLAEELSWPENYRSLVLLTLGSNANFSMGTCLPCWQHIMADREIPLLGKN